jgi:fructose-bisphosphate aldolase class II
MTLVTLAQVLQPALHQGYAVPGLVCLGWEDMRAFVTAAQAEQAPLILQAGPGCRAHTPIPILAAMFRHLAASVDIPVVAHLDHAHSIEECKAALDAGFTSVMFDGSRLPLAENIARTAAVAAVAHAAGASCEGEIGFVGYAQGAASEGTDPEEAASFAAETGVDAMAISVGNIHLQQNPGTGLDLARLDAIQKLTPTPLVIHGGSGVPPAQRADLAARSHICKFNIGTELRQVFGQSLRATLAAHPDRFDRIEILRETEAPLTATARAVIRSMGASGRAAR